MKRLVNLGLTPKFQGARKKFIYASTGTPVDVIVEGEYPVDGSIRPIAFPNPEVSRQSIDNFDVISLSKLIELKFASYQRLPTTRGKDRTDVIELMKTLHLNQSFSDLLHPSIRNEFEKLIVGLEKERESINNE